MGDEQQTRKMALERRRRLWWIDLEDLGGSAEDDNEDDIWEITRPGTCPVCKDLDPRGQKGAFVANELDVTRLATEFSQSADATGCRFCRLISDGIAMQAKELLAGNTMVTLSGRVGGCIFIQEDFKGKKFEDLIKLEFYCPEGSVLPLETIARCQEIASHAKSEKCFKLIHEWALRCSREHDCCQNLSVTTLPKRVIDVGTPESVPYLYESNGETGVYLALSYCWGTLQTFKTERSTLQQRVAGLNWSLLPKTFQDAIIVARKLAVRYLWIDSLCIIQDDLQDWEVESSKMKTIYEHAYITIAALSGLNHNAGLFAARKNPSSMLDLQPYNMTGLSHPVSVRRTIHHLHNNGPLSNSQCALFKRGWTYQERLLSRRVLYYGHSELSWECRGATYCECASYKPSTQSWEDDSSLRLHQAYSILHGVKSRVKYREDEDCYYWWRHVVLNDYQNRKLTKSSDCLPALSGLAAAVQARTSDVYLAGIWGLDLLHGLLWSASESAQLPSEYRAPSWAWPSIQGKASFVFGRNEFIWQCQVIAASCSLAGQDLTGAVKDGFVTLIGPVTTADLTITELKEGSVESDLTYTLFMKEPNQQDQKGIPIRRPRHVIQEFMPDVALVGDSGLLKDNQTERTVKRSKFLPNDPRPAVEGRVFLLLLATNTKRESESYRFLVLGRSISRPGTFERIGLLTFLDFPWDKHGKNLTQKAKTLEISIV